MGDVSCPYCGEEAEINHDDGYGYSEEEKYAQQCDSCEKTFTFQTSIILHYEVAEASCLNGGEHDWKPSFTFPIEHTKGVCSICWEERKATPGDMTAALAYREIIAARIALEDTP